MACPRLVKLLPILISGVACAKQDAAAVLANTAADECPLSDAAEGIETLVSFMQTSVVTHRRADDVYSYVEQLLYERSRHGAWWEDSSAVAQQGALPAAMGVTLAEVAQNSSDNIAKSNATLAQPVEDGEGTATEVSPKNEPNALVWSLSVNAGLVGIAVLAGAVLRSCYPALYMRDARARGLSREGCLSGNPAAPAGVFGWMTSSARMSVDDVVMYGGLDQGMFVHFLNLALQILAAVALPALAILMPLHYHYGHNNGVGKLGKLDLMYLKEQHWFHWVHAGLVWYVVLVSELLIFYAHRAFINRRTKWLKEMPAPRATTVLVENIAMGGNTEVGMRDYFDNHVFGRPVVRDAFVVKDTSELLHWIEKLEAANQALERTWQGKVPLNGVGSVLMVRKREAEQQVERLREEIDKTDELNSNSAFVTFDSQREVIAAVKMFPSGDKEDVTVSVPPEPTDVIWSDLMVGGRPRRPWEYLGVLLLAALFAGLVAAGFGIAFASCFETLREKAPFVKSIFGGRTAVLAGPWDGVLAPFALTLLLSFIPSLLMLIFCGCFLSKAQTWLQHRVQRWYFSFTVLIVFGTGIAGAVMRHPEVAEFEDGSVLEHPMNFFTMLARSIPLSAHFYLFYVPFAWSAAAMSITRYGAFFKFLVYRRFYDEMRATQCCEPEDQDYFGIGSRSARMSFMLILALVFSTMCPLVGAFGLVNFGICRLVYPYLFVHAEMEKPDSGGLFWGTMIEHLHLGLFLFIGVMTAVLLDRGNGFGPGLLCAGSFVLLVVVYDFFQREFRWELLEIRQLQESAAAEKRKPTALNYKQPELPPPQVPLVMGTTRLQDAMAAFQTRVGAA